MQLAVKISIVLMTVLYSWQNKAQSNTTASIIPEVNIGRSDMSVKFAGQKNIFKNESGSIKQVNVQLCLPYNKLISLVGGLHYSNRSNQISLYDKLLDSSTSKYTVLFDIQNIGYEISMMFNLYLTKRNKINLQVGIQDFYGIGGNIQTDLYDRQTNKIVESERTKIKFGNNMNDDFVRRNSVLVFKSSYSFRDRFRIGGFAYIGVTDLMPRKERFTNVKTYDFGISLGYIIHTD